MKRTARDLGKQSLGKRSRMNESNEGEQLSRSPSPATPLDVAQTPPTGISGHFAAGSPALQATSQGIAARVAQETMSKLMMGAGPSSRTSQTSPEALKAQPARTVPSAISGSRGGLVFFGENTSAQYVPQQQSQPARTVPSAISGPKGEVVNLMDSALSPRVKASRRRQQKLAEKKSEKARTESSGALTDFGEGTSTQPAQRQPSQPQQDTSDATINTIDRRLEVLIYFNLDRVTTEMQGLIRREIRMGETGIRIDYSKILIDDFKTIRKRVKFLNDGKIPRGLPDEGDVSAAFNRIKHTYENIGGDPKNEAVKGWFKDIKFDFARDSQQT